MQLIKDMIKFSWHLNFFQTILNSNLINPILQWPIYSTTKSQVTVDIYCIAERRLSILVHFSIIYMVYSSIPSFSPFFIWGQSLPRGSVSHLYNLNNSHQNAKCLHMMCRHIFCDLLLPFSFLRHFISIYLLILSH